MIAYKIIGPCRAFAVKCGYSFRISISHVKRAFGANRFVSESSRAGSNEACLRRLSAKRESTAEYKRDCDL